MDLSTQAGPIKFKNPVILASGTYGYGPKKGLNRQISRLGGFITKTITLKERLGNMPPRIAETASGILNSVGLENPGIERFCRDYLKEIAELQTTRIISIGGVTAEDFLQAIRILQNNNYKIFQGIELNISCPNVEKGGLCIAQSPAEAGKTVRMIKKAAKLPVIVKLSPNVTDIKMVAQSVLDNGADAISLINTITSLAIDWRKRISLLGGFSGGLSGPAVKPIALRMVYEVASKTKADVIGIGGIMNAEDALEFMAVGAKAVQVGTLNLADPFAVFNIPEEMAGILKKEGIKSAREFMANYKIK